MDIKSSHVRVVVLCEVMNGFPLSMRVLHKSSSWAGLVALGLLTGCFRPEDIAVDSAGDSTASHDETGNAPDSTGDTGRDPDSSGDGTAGDGLPWVVAGDDRYYIEEQGQTLTVAAAEGLLVNDRDPNGGVLAVEGTGVISTREGGRVQATADGGFTYTPPVNGWWGEDGFVYTVVADDGRSAEGRVRVVTRPQSIALAQVRAGTGGFALEGEAANDHAGASVSGVGDVNGDGFADLIIGADGVDVLDPENSGATLDDAGRSYVVFGGENRQSGLLLNIGEEVDGFAFDGEAAVNHAGGSVSGAGDVNGDGMADVIIGANLADPNGLANSGRSYVVYGGHRNSGSLTTISSEDGGFVLDGEAAGDYAGKSVSGAGDVNGDGFADLVIGAHRVDPLDPNGSGASFSAGGRAYVIYGEDGRGSGPLSAIVDGVGGFALDGGNSFDYTGQAVGRAGDVNGDGFADVIIGAYSADPRDPENADATLNAGGRSYVVFGDTSRSSDTLTAIGGRVDGFAFDGEAAGDFAGVSVNGAGDVNGDGYEDVIIGAHRADLDH